MLSPDPSNLSLALALALSIYLTLLVSTPPNQPPKAPSSQPKDRIHLVTTPIIQNQRRRILTAVSLYHTLLSLLYPSPPSYLCPNPSNLNPVLFTWSPTTIICITAILLAAPIRLLAFKQLGQNFTFQLAPPRNLVTSGMYRYIQHPSYLTHGTGLLANGWLFLRVDGGLGCWLGEGVVGWVGWRWIGWGLIVFGVEMVRRRVVDEEGMLREKVGVEWEVWHKKTKRFIPFVF